MLIQSCNAVFDLFQSLFMFSEHSTDALKPVHHLRIVHFKRIRSVLSQNHLCNQNFIRYISIYNTSFSQKLFHRMGKLTDQVCIFHTAGMKHFYVQVVVMSMNILFWLCRDVVIRSGKEIRTPSSGCNFNMPFSAFFKYISFKVLISSYFSWLCDIQYLKHNFTIPPELCNCEHCSTRDILLYCIHPLYNQRGCGT